MLFCLLILAIDIFRQLCETTSSWYSRKEYERSRGKTFIALFNKLLTRCVSGSDATEKSLFDGKKQRASGCFYSLLATCGCNNLKTPKQQADYPPAPPASNAKVVNLVRGDTYDISQRFWDFPKFISQPVKVIFTVYFLFDIIGWPSTIGFALMVIFLIVNSLLVRYIVILERKRTAYSDKRSQACAHFVEAGRPLKLNGWTTSWSRRILRFRCDEILQRLRIARVSVAISTINIAGGAVYPLASISFFTLVLRWGLPNDVIWPSLQLFSQLEASIKETFDLFSAFWKTTIPVDRVNRYLAEPNRDEVEPSLNDAVQDIEFREAFFSWLATGHLVLQNTNLRFSPGLTIIRGKIGSGKSSLLLASLNEMELCHGQLLRPVQAIGYSQQLPWLQSMSIRHNIVFHHPFNPIRYLQVLHVCALTSDLELLPGGDQYRLEEEGIGLSGVQKARVTLARVIYSPCRVLLLDDPLAALDHDTASDIVRRFLQGPLAKGRTIVLATHRDDLVLRIANQVIDMNNGRATILTPERVRSELENPIHAQTPEMDLDEAQEPDDDHNEESGSTKRPPEEPAETGNVSLSVYLGYVKAGGWLMWALLVLFYGLSRYCDILRARLLEAWSNITAHKPDNISHRYLGLRGPEEDTKTWLALLAGLGSGQILAHAIAQLLFAQISVNAAQGIFTTAIERISKATFRYYDVTPTGQLKNRLISDMSMVDGGILSPLEGFVYNLIALVLSMVAITVQQPLLLVILGLVAILFVHYFRIYVPVTRCLRRMEMRYLTPIIANIGVMQDGLVTIRALQVEQNFRDRHLEAVDDFQKHDHFFWSMAFWLNVRLRIASACARAAVILWMIWVETPASAVGFVLTQTVIAMACIQQLCELFAQLQLDAVSLERVNMLNSISEEPAGDGNEPEDDWPRSSDAIHFNDVSFRYADNLPDVIDKVNFEIPGGATCAVLVRTGSGKSTIANALLVTETASEGTIRVGNIDLAHVNRTTLRNRITFIQQDPVLFPGTLHDNLDPEGKFSDEDCLKVIHRVLGSVWNITSPIDVGGKNMSQGQRQLVGIGRAVLRRSGLVILDEATASIDRTTAATVQRILREELSKSTVIIAHRLEAVESASWCLRLERGRVIECGPTLDLQRH